MGTKVTTDADLTSIANAIRAKGRTSAGLEYPTDFITAIGNLPSGEGSAIGIDDTTDSAGGTIRTLTAVSLGNDTVSPEHLESGYTAHNYRGEAIVGTMPAPVGDVTESDVNFIDYDGTLVASRTKAQINAMTSDSDLPSNPTHTGLTSQGWNWTVAQLKAQLTAMPDQPIWVGQMYITASGKTEIDVTMPEGRLSPIMTICVNGEVSIDWGDNSTPDTVTGTSGSDRLAVSHTYVSAGSYTIKITSVSGTYNFYGSDSYTLLRKNDTANENRVYSNCIQHIRLGSGITSIGPYAFYYCYSLTSVTIPDSVTSIGTGAFYYCDSLVSVTIPSSVTSIGGSVFNGCYSLISVTIPSGVTSISENAFYFCNSLTSVTIPSGVTSIGSSVFRNCYVLTSVTVTSIGTYAFYNCYSLASITIQSGVTSIGSNTFYNCYSLASVTIPSGVTSIASNAFYNCYGMAEYHFQSTNPPTLSSTTAFTSISSDCIIYVPYSADHSVLNAYKTAQNWSDYASYMQEEPAS